MGDDEDTSQNERHRRFRGTVGDKEQRKLRARRRGATGAWFWLGMFGMVGWSVAIPTVLFVALGRWLDRVVPAPFSWTLTMLVVGVAVGCLVAWYWVRRESRSE